MKFSGLYTAILTPFCDGGNKVDFDSYHKLVERQIQAGVSGIVPCGTTGESPTLSHEEHRKLIARTVEYAKGKAMVIAGTGSNSTQEAIELTKAACKDGVDAVMLVSPYYNKPNQEGLQQHFTTIADHSSVPVMLYNIQGRTGVNIEVQTIEELSKHKRILAIKEASGDPSQMIRIKKACGDKLSLLCGDDNITPAFMGIGGQGTVSVASNIYPQRMVRILDLYLKGNFSQANHMFYQLVDFMNALFQQPNPICVKAAAEITKLCERTVRLPLLPLSPQTDLYKQLQAMIEEIGVDA